MLCPTHRCVTLIRHNQKATLQRDVGGDTISKDDGVFNLGPKDSIGLGADQSVSETLVKGVFESSMCTAKVS